jgi:hypothetical protein
MTPGWRWSAPRGGSGAERFRREAKASGHMPESDPGRFADRARFTLAASVHSRWRPPSVLKGYIFDPFNIPSQITS